MLTLKVKEHPTETNQAKERNSRILLFQKAKYFYTEVNYKLTSSGLIHARLGSKR